MSGWSVLLEWVMAPRLRRFRRDLDDPARAQRARLDFILRHNARTRFGREHGFDRLLRAPADERPARFRQAVPVRNYDGFAPWMADTEDGVPDVLVPGRPSMFSVTSGTTAGPKHCPVTRAFTLEHHRAHLVWMVHFQRDHPGVAPGKYLCFVSPAEEGRTAGGIPYGAMSGRQILNQAVPIRRRQAVPYAVAAAKPASAKPYAALVHALGGPVSMAMAVNPATLHLLGKTLHDHAEALLEDVAAGTLRHAPGLAPDARAALERGLAPKPARAETLAERLRADGGLWPRNAWPECAALATWQGGSAPFFARRLAETWGNVPQRCLGLRASEGTFTVPLADFAPEGVFFPSGHVVEFVPEAEGPPAPHAPTLAAHELETGRRYRMVVTTSGGFYRYDLADVVEVAGWRGRTPELAFLHRAGSVLSLTGEKVGEEQAVRAVARAVADAGVTLAGFTVTADPAAEPPRYELWIERETPATPEADAALAARFDRALADANPEYAARRDAGRLGPAATRRVPAGAYAAFRERLIASGRPDGQVKPPHLEPPPGAFPPRDGVPGFLAELRGTVKNSPFVRKRGGAE